MSTISSGQITIIDTTDIYIELSQNTIFIPVDSNGKSINSGSKNIVITVKNGAGTEIKGNNLILKVNDIPVSLSNNQYVYPYSWEQNQTISATVLLITAKYLNKYIATPINLSILPSINGEKGDDGIGISSIIEQYLLWNSNISVPSDAELPIGKEWSSTCPTWQSNSYIWTRNQITWDNDVTDINHITYTAPVLAEGLNNANSTANTANTTANQANSTANTANTNASTAITTVNNIKNGDTPISFQIGNNANATVEISKSVGIKVSDVNQNYFQTTATQMGFFKHYIDDNNQDAYTQQLGFTDGNLFVKNGALIGGWTTTNNSLYSGSASTFDANNGIYLGTGGLSVSGNNYKVHFNTPEFLINVDEGNTILQIDKTGAVMKNLIVTDNLIAPNLNGAIYNGSNTIYIGTTNDCDYTRLDECANMLNNKILLQDVTIYIKNEIVQNNDYPKATFSGITGSGNIHIIGYNNEIQIIRQQLEIINCFVTIDFSYLKFIERFYSRLILISGSKMVSFSDCVFWGVVLLENNIPTDRCTETLITVDNGSKVFFASCEFELAKTYIRGYPGTEIIIINSGFNLYKLPNESNNSYTGITVNRSNWRSFIINGVNLKIKSNDTKIDENLGTKWNYQYQKIDCETVIERYMAVDYFYSSILYTYQGDETTSGMDYTPASQSIDTVEKTKNDLKPSTKNTAYITNEYWENNNNSGWNNDTTNLSQGYVYNSDNSRTYGNIGCVWFNLGFLQDKTITGGKLYFSRAQGAGQQTNGITTTIKILKITTPTNFSYNNNNFGTYSFSESSILWNQPVVINLSTAFIEELYNNGNPYAIAFVANDENYNFNDHKYSRNYCKIPISSISLTITYR